MSAGLSECQETSGYDQTASNLERDTVCPSSGRPVDTETPLCRVPPCNGGHGPWRELKMSLPGLVAPKTVHLIRHAQGVHNEAKELQGTRMAYLDERWQDACLTSLGVKQAQQAAADFFRNCTAPQLVVVSPLARTLQTAVEMFGACELPLLAVEEVREQYGVCPCDKRSDRSVQQKKFAAVDFSLIETNGDTLWEADIRESDVNIANRARRFLLWLAARPETDIAVVTHQSFLRSLIGVASGTGLLVEPFTNCERRTVVLSPL